MTVLEMKVEALMRCVPPGALAKALADIKSENEITASDNVAVDRKIRALLTELGTPAGIKGHRYLVYAIKLVFQDESLLSAITSKLYPMVAERYATIPSNVERGIRWAIETTWERGELKTLQRYFGNTIKLTSGKPTNSEFIAQLANIIRDQTDA